MEVDGPGDGAASGSGESGMEELSDEDELADLRNDSAEFGLALDEADEEGAGGGRRRRSRRC